jgi:hypothetical protein
VIRNKNDIDLRVIVVILPSVTVSFSTSFSTVAASMTLGAETMDCEDVEDDICSVVKGEEGGC